MIDGIAYYEDCPCTDNNYIINKRALAFKTRCVYLDMYFFRTKKSELMMQPYMFTNFVFPRVNMLRRKIARGRISRLFYAENEEYRGCFTSCNLITNVFETKIRTLTISTINLLIISCLNWHFSVIFIHDLPSLLKQDGRHNCLYIRFLLLF